MQIKGILSKHIIIISKNIIEYKKLMRLREPFSGYRLTSGHYIFHLAFLIGGSTLQISYGQNIQANLLDDASKTFFLLQLAHILVPMFTLA